MGWPSAPRTPMAPHISLEELCRALGQEEQAEALCVLPFFPGIDSWAVEEGSSEGKSCALFHKGDN